MRDHDDHAALVTDRAFRAFGTDASELVQPPGVPAAQRRAATRRRNRVMASSSVALGLVVAVVGTAGYAAGLWPPRDQNPLPAAAPPAVVATPAPPSLAPPTVSSTETTEPGKPEKPETPPGIAYDPARIPAGDKGSAERRITAATDQPAWDGSAIFRTLCAYGGMRPADPVRSGDDLAPLHTFWGNAPGGRGTCRGGVVDRSTYYVPAVIDTRDGTPIAPVQTNVYYAKGRVPASSVEPLPADLVLQATEGDWACPAPYFESDRIPSNCADKQLEYRVYFPQCWDGKRADSPGHRAHVAYPGANGCPPSHPVALPAVSYHLRYELGGDTGAYRLSTAPGGTFVNGWDTQIMTTWVRRCVNAGASCHSHLLGDGRAIEGP